MDLRIQEVSYSVALGARALLGKTAKRNREKYSPVEKCVSSKSIRIPDLFDKFSTGRKFAVSET